MLKPLTAALATTLLLGCASAETREAAPHDGDTAVTFTEDAYPSTYVPVAAPTCCSAAGKSSRWAPDCRPRPAR